MKRILSLIIAGAAGGLMVLAGIFTSDHYAEKKLKAKGAHFVTNERQFLEDLPDNFTKAAQRAMPAVVHIKVKESRTMARHRQRDYSDPFSFFFGDDFFGGPRNREGKGSGVVISSDGYIVTNNHVIEKTDRYEVTLHDDRTFTAELIGADPRTDLAVLKIDGNDLSYLPFKKEDEVEVGEWVIAVGNPFDLTSTVTAGIVSAKGRDKILRRNDAIEDFIQTDAVVNPGNSGGALVDRDGNLIGINTAIATATGYYAGYSFAIPADIAAEVVKNIIEYGGARVSLGISAASIPDYEQYTTRDLNIESGVVVYEVDNGSAAQYAGILPGDVIVRINDTEIKTVTDLSEIIQGHNIGEEIEVTLMRNNKREKIMVRLKSS